MYEQSVEINEIAGALAVAQSKFEKVVKDTDNPFFKSKYADLASLIEATRTALAAEGIAVVQAVGFEEEKCSVTTSLLHKSGQWLRGNIRIPLAKMDAQGMGSASTYGRRYALQSMLNVAGEADDDGNAASEKQVVKPKTVPFRQQLQASVNLESEPPQDNAPPFDDSFLDDPNERPQDKPQPAVRTGSLISVAQAKRFKAIAMTTHKAWQPINNFLGGRGYEDAEQITRNDYLESEPPQDNAPPFDDSFLDDPNERPQDKPQPAVRTGSLISVAQAKRFKAIAMTTHKAWQPINNFLGGRGYEDAEQITRNDYDACIAWAEGK